MPPRRPGRRLRDSQRTRVLRALDHAGLVDPRALASLAETERIIGALWFRASRRARQRRWPWWTRMDAALSTLGRGQWHGLHGLPEIKDGRRRRSIGITHRAGMTPRGNAPLTPVVIRLPQRYRTPMGCIVAVAYAWSVPPEAWHGREFTARLLDLLPTAANLDDRARLDRENHPVSVGRLRDLYRTMKIRYRQPRTLSPAGQLKATARGHALVERARRPLAARIRRIDLD